MYFVGFASFPRFYNHFDLLAKIEADLGISSIKHTILKTIDLTG